jgi:hypothetical protein
VERKKGEMRGWIGVRERLLDEAGRERWGRRGNEEEEADKYKEY